MTSRSVRQQRRRHAALRQRLPVLIAAAALLATSWLTADGVPASEPQQITENESLLTITETVEAPMPPAPRIDEQQMETPVPTPPSTETEASPTTPEDEPEQRKPAKDCDKQVRFTPLDDPATEEEDADKADKADEDCTVEKPAKKKRHRRKSTDLRNSDGSPATTNPGFIDVLPGPSSSAGVPNFIIRKFRVPPFLLPIYQAAGIEYGIRWEVLAAINEIETDYGRNLNVSSAGAVGWMQFIRRLGGCTAPTPTRTAARIPTTRSTRSSPPPATCRRPATRTTCAGRSLPTTTPTGTSTPCCSGPG